MTPHISHTLSYTGTTHSQTHPWPIWNHQRTGLAGGNGTQVTLLLTLTHDMLHQNASTFALGVLQSDVNYQYTLIIHTAVEQVTTLNFAATTL